MKFSHLLTFTSILAMTAVPLRAEEPKTAPATPQNSSELSPVDPEALKIIKSAVDRIASAPQFSVNTEIWEDIDIIEGHNLQFTKLIDIQLRRPDRVQLNIRTTEPKRSFYYNGKQLTVHDHLHGYFATVAAPATIDEMLMAVEEGFGVKFPLEDLLISKPFGNGAAAATSAQYFGVEPVLGVTCHHLAFQNAIIDWQAWVEEGDQPVIRKVVLTFLEEANNPQFTVIFSKWDFSTEIDDASFAFTAPDGTHKLEMLPMEKPEDKKTSVEKAVAK